MEREMAIAVVRKDIMVEFHRFDQQSMVEFLLRNTFDQHNIDNAILRCFDESKLYNQIMTVQLLMHSLCTMTSIVSLRTAPPTDILLVNYIYFS